MSQQVQEAYEQICVFRQKTESTKQPKETVITNNNEVVIDNATSELNFRSLLVFLLGVIGLAIIGCVIAMTDNNSVREVETVTLEEEYSPVNEEVRPITEEVEPKVEESEEMINEEVPLLEEEMNSGDITRGEDESTIQIKAEYPGGMAAFNREFISRFKTPNVDSNVKKITVIVQFVVEIDGSLSDIKVARDPGYGTGEESVRVLESMSKWKAAVQNNRNVRSQFTLPITIQVQ